MNQDLLINKSELDEELVKQAALFYSASESYVDAAAMRDTKKEELATVDAELDAEMRLGNEKVTEARIKSMIQTHPRHQEAFVAYNEAKLLADRAGVLKEAWHQRSFMLRELVEIHMSSFYMPDAIKSTASELAYERQRESVARARNK